MAFKLRWLRRGRTGQQFYRNKKTKNKGTLRVFFISKIPKAPKAQKVPKVTKVKKNTKVTKVPKVPKAPKELGIRN